jgi:nicotinate dehydrogenase subunit A
MAQINLKVNGKAVSVSVEPDTPLLYVLRNDLQLYSPRFGCGLAQCGACSVLVGGREMRSCVLPVGRVSGDVVTVEGLGSGGKLHPLQSAFIAEQACQCGYCGSGMVMAAKALLDANPQPTPAQVRQALNGHLCRCASHNRILRAVERAARELHAGAIPAGAAADADAAPARVASGQA